MNSKRTLSYSFFHVKVKSIYICIQNPFTYVFILKNHTFILFFISIPNTFTILYINAASLHLFFYMDTKFFTSIPNPFIYFIKSHYKEDFCLFFQGTPTLLLQTKKQREIRMYHSLLFASYKSFILKITCN